MERERGREGREPELSMPPRRLYRKARDLTQDGPLLAHTCPAAWACARSVGASVRACACARARTRARALVWSKLCARAVRACAVRACE